MPSELDEQKRLARLEAAAYISSHITDFKLCEGCDSILRIETIFCGICNHYRFNYDPVEIVKMAEILASRPRSQLSSEDYGF
jgi:hypothetical protein